VLETEGPKKRKKSNSYRPSEPNRRWAKKGWYRGKKQKKGSSFGKRLAAERACRPSLKKARKGERVSKGWATNELSLLKEGPIGPERSAPEEINKRKHWVVICEADLRKVVSGGQKKKSAGRRKSGNAICEKSGKLCRKENCENVRKRNQRQGDCLCRGTKWKRPRGERMH